MSAPHSTPDAAIVFDALNAYQRTEALKAAIELDLFSAISTGPASAAELAGSLQATERGVRILSDFLVICGLLTKENGKYGLTPTAATFLDRKSPAYLGGIVGFLSHPVLTDNFKHLATAVRTGRLLSWNWRHAASNGTPMKSSSRRISISGCSTSRS